MQYKSCKWLESDFVFPPQKDATWISMEFKMYLEEINLLISMLSFYQKLSQSKGAAAYRQKAKQSFHFSTYTAL